METDFDYPQKDLIELVVFDLISTTLRQSI